MDVGLGSIAKVRLAYTSHCHARTAEPPLATPHLLLLLLLL
jgi:hypothetical protein